MRITPRVLGSCFFLLATILFVFLGSSHLSVYAASSPAPTPGTGLTYYVSPSGSDSNNGKSLTAPFNTITKAKGVVNPGDTIEIRAGTYSEGTIKIDRAGALNNWILMRAYQGESVSVLGTGSEAPFYFRHDDCDEDPNSNGNTDCHPLYWIMQGLDVQGSSSGGGDGNVVKIDTPRVKLIGNKFHCSKADVVKLVRTSNDVEIIGNDISQSGCAFSPTTNAQGIDIVGADRTIVANNYVHDVPDIGIYAKGNSRNTIFENNRLENIGNLTGSANNTGHGLMLGQQTDKNRLLDGDYETYDGIVRNNIVVNSTWACIAVGSSFNAHVYNNSCYNTATRSHGSLFVTNESLNNRTNTNIEFRNNIVYGGSAALPVIKVDSNTLSSPTTLAVSNNIYYVPGGAPKFTWGSATVTDNSVVANPLYTSLTTLAIGANSPAVNTGVTTGYVTQDYTGVSRPQGSAYDIGAYEYSGTSPTSSPTPTPSATPAPKVGDIDGDGDVDIFDYNRLVSKFGQTGTIPEDINGSGKVDIFDYNLLVGHFGN